MNASESGGSNVVLITPIYQKQVGGAAIYYQRLTQSLGECGVSVSVITDSVSGDAPGLRRYGIFPKWASSERNLVRDVVSYAYQNITYYRISGILRRESPQAVLVHSSFHNHPGVFALAMARARRACPTATFVADVRDRLLPPRKIAQLKRYDTVIACSGNVRDHLIASGLPADRIREIPVIQERLQISDTAAGEALTKYGLEGRKYILYVGAIKEDKAVDKLLMAFIDHVAPIHPDHILVLAGLLKSNAVELNRLMRTDKVRYIGNVDRADALALMKGANVCVNVSPNEGMPRASLEALALGRPVVLPPNVPEFVQYCERYVATDLDPKCIAEKMTAAIIGGKAADYPVDRHYPESVLEAYLEVLGIRR